MQPTAAAQSSAPKLKGIVFDMDGTLWYVFQVTRVPIILSNWCLRCVFDIPPYETSFSESLFHNHLISIQKLLTHIFSNVLCSKMHRGVRLHKRCSEPQTYMFGEMRASLGIPKTVDILAHIESLPASEQLQALEAIRAIERRAMLTQKPSPGLGTLMAYLDALAVPKAICTRNFDAPVRNLLDKFLAGSHFHPIVTRDFKPPKPDPAGILHIASNWGLQDELGRPDATGLIMIGDSVDDMTAGRLAGAATVLLLSDVNGHLASHAHTDLTIRRLDDMVAILDQGFQGREMLEK